MPNAYLTLHELRAAAADGLSKTTFKYDPRMLALLSETSRWADDYCHRVFYPYLDTRYFDGTGTPCLDVDDLISITSVSYSTDWGVTYTALTAADYIAMHGDDYNARQSYDRLRVDANSTTLGSWPCGQKSVKVVGVWGYCDDRNTCFESTGDTVQNTTSIAAGGASLKVSSVDGLDIWGGEPRFSPGGLYRIESEYLEANLTRDETANTMGVLRGRNGTTDATHLNGVSIYVWRAPEPVRQAVAIQASRLVQRGKQNFGDARATPELGEMFYMRSIDPEAKAKLEPYVRARAH